METIYPLKLCAGDEVRIVAPSRSLSKISKENVKLSGQRLSELGFKVTYGKNCYEIDEFGSSSIQSRVEDLNEAFRDKNVKGILTVVGGYNCNQILKYLDYELIKSNPKVLCGYSDVAALQNAIYAKTGLVTYSGPHFSTFGMKKGFEPILISFKEATMNSELMRIVPSKKWSDDLWFLDQENRTFLKNEGYFIINEGEAEGVILGSNLCTFNLLQGTEFMPSLNNSILFLEDDGESKSENFDRDLQSIIHMSDFSEVKGIVIGRFSEESKVDNNRLLKIIKTKKELDKIPIIANVDFGHTYPLITFPIGGKVKISAKGKEAKIIILRH